MNLIVKVLREIAPIDNFSYWPSDRFEVDLSAPPIVWWKFKEPTKGLADFFEQSVDTFQGAVAWEFYHETGMMWILMPKRIREYEESHGCNGDLVAAAELKVKDPGFGKRANDDVPLLAEHIHRCLNHAT